MTPHYKLPAWQQQVADLPESQAHLLLDAMAAKHGWSYALWTRADAIAALGATPNRPARVLGRREWNRVAATAAWADLPRLAYNVVDAERVIEAAIKEAGLECSNCDAPLYLSPDETGRLCDRCRRGPDGQAVEPDPITGGLWYLVGDDLYYAHPAHDDQSPTLPEAIRFDPATASVDETQRAERIRRRLQVYARVSFREITAALHARGIPAVVVDTGKTDSIGVGHPSGSAHTARHPVHIGPAAGFDDQIGHYGVLFDLYITVGTGADGSDGASYYAAQPGDTAETLAARASQALDEHTDPPRP
ncbi:MAG: hypothetical protein HOV83_14395 [Catenulispora sp.]|nr:hypothetical protein [Catenulispora sp.]